MSKLIWALLLSGMVILAPVPAQADDAEPAPPTARSLEELDRQLAEVFAADSIPGASVAVVEKGEIVFAKGYGVADTATGMPVTTDTVFRAGSISKSLTSIAVMTLVEQGRLSLDARLADLAPGIAFENPWEATDPVRLVHLLEHTTGWQDVALRIYTLDGKGWPLLRGVQEASGGYVSRWKPGFYPLYNNAAPAVAGYVIERVTGQTFDIYMRDAVLRPMGMASADFDPSPELMARLAKSYNADGEATPYQHIVLGPSGSLVATPTELAQLVRLLIGRGSVDGRQMLTPESVARIERGESSLAGRLGQTGGYGLGNAPLADKGPLFRGHNGGIDSFTAVYGYRADIGAGYVLMANGGAGVDFATPVSRLVEAYLARDMQVSPPAPVAVDAATLDAYAGTYRNVTPPSALLRPIAEFASYLGGVSVEDGKLHIGDREFVATAPGIFRRAERAEANVAFAEVDGQMMKLSVFGAAVQEPAWRAVLVYAIAVLLALGLVVSVPMFFVWIVGLFRGRLRDRGGALVRFAPFAALIALFLTFALVLKALSGGEDGMRLLGTEGAYTYAIFAMSLIFPLLAALAFWRSLKAHEANLFVRLYAGLTSFAVLAAAAYLATIGWVGLQTWTM